MVTLDHDLRSPKDEVEYQMAYYRQSAEEEWDAEFAALPEAERSEVAAAETQGCRLYEEDGEWYAGNPEGSDVAVEVGPFGGQAEAARAYVMELAPAPAP